MTDNEIIKALENIITYAKYIESNCVKIPVDLLQLTIDLIERQHTEKFKLQLKIPKLEQENDELQREIKNVYEEGLRLNDIFFGFVEKRKSEAVKEFAERLKEDAEYICDDTYIEKDLKEYVDNYVKLKYDNNDAFIEGTELAIDYGLTVPEEDLKKYEKIVDKSKTE